MTGKALDGAKGKLGIDPRHSFHNLRHSATTHLLERGADADGSRLTEDVRGRGSFATAEPVDKIPE